jgi:hypothetical protein
MSYKNIIFVNSEIKKLLFINLTSCIIIKDKKKELKPIIVI